MPRLPPVRPAQTSKMSAPGPRVRRHVARKPPRSSRTRIETRQCLTRKASQKSGLAPENSHPRNTEQQPDVAARHPSDTNYYGAAQTPRLRPFHKTQILTVISKISTANQKSEQFVTVT